MLVEEELDVSLFVPLLVLLVDFFGEFGTDVRLLEFDEISEGDQRAVGVGDEHLDLLLPGALTGAGVAVAVTLTVATATTGAVGGFAVFVR